MPIKAEGSGDPREIDRWEGGVGWIAHPEEAMQRASHALATDEGVWVIDPVDGEGVEDLYREFGDVRGVVVALNRHKRDAAAFADRHGVPVYAPHWMKSDVEGLQAPIETFDERLPGTSYRVIEVVNNPVWKELALYDPEGGTLVVAEAVGTTDYFLTGGERLGVHPALRAVPPRRALGDVAPDRVLVGHGAGVFEDASSALHDALEGSRRGMPSLYAKNARMLLPF